LGSIYEALYLRLLTPAYAAIGADICQHHPYLATQLWFSGLTVGRIVLRKTKIINFILSSIGQADIAPNIPTALSGAVSVNFNETAQIINSAYLHNSIICKL